MTFDEKAWRFPIEELVPADAFICLTKRELSPLGRLVRFLQPSSDQVWCSGVRLECRPISLPDLNWSYERTEVVAPEIYVNFEFKFQGLRALRRTRLTPSYLGYRPGADLGSVYLFSRHNPVSWTSVEFGEADGDAIEARIEVEFDFDFEGAIGGTPSCAFETRLAVERRWEDDENDA